MKWEFETGGRVESSPAIGSDGTVYVGSGFWDSKVYALDGKTGTKKWEFELGTIRSPISKKSSVPISLAIGAESTVYVLSTDGKIYALDGKQLGQKPQAHARPESTTNRLGTNPPPTLDSYFEIGYILAFDPQSAFYVINIGANNGIVVGDEYAVFKGSSLAGIIRIKRTESTLAIATGLKVFGQGKIQVGDKVYKLK
jgi:glucose dehydrogenase